MKRIGMLTSGGDCQALNATMRGVAKGLFNNLDKVEIYGFLEGYKGLMHGNYRKMSEKDFSGILTRGGTILGKAECYIRSPDIVINGFRQADDIQPFLAQHICGFE